MGVEREVVTEFLGAFKIQADNEEDYFQKREELLTKLKSLGVDIIDITPIETDIETASQEWNQWNKIDQILEDDLEEDDFTVSETIDECYEAKPVSEENSFSRVSSNQDMTEERLFKTYPKLQHQLEMAAYEYGVDIDDFEFLQCLREELDLELIFQDRHEGEHILFVEVSVDAIGDTLIRNFIVEETYADDAEGRPAAVGAQTLDDFLSDDRFFNKEAFSDLNDISEFSDCQIADNIFDE